MLQCSGEGCEIIVCGFAYFDRFGAGTVAGWWSVALPARARDDGDIEAKLEQSWDDGLAQATRSLDPWSQYLVKIREKTAKVLKIWDILTPRTATF